MNFKIVKHIIFLFILFSIIKLNAQPKVYHSEIGALAGISSYMGDYSKQFLKNPQPAYSFIFRQKFNPRIAAHANITYSNILIDSIYVNNLNIELPVDPFKYQMLSMDACAEFNFFSYEDKPFRPFSKKYTTFLFAGLGIGSSIYQLHNTSVNVYKPFYSIPFGVGFKAMLGERFNFNALWTTRIVYSFDKINLFAKTASNSTSVFNKDFYSTMSIGITYNIFRKKCDCKYKSR